MKHIDLTDMLRVTRARGRVPWHPLKYSLQRWEPHQRFEDGVYKSVISNTSSDRVRDYLERIDVSEDVMQRFDEYAPRKL